MGAFALNSAEGRRACGVQVNALSHIRKARLGRLDPVFKKQGKVQGRTYHVLPPEVVAVHEAKSRAAITKRLAAQGTLARTHRPCTHKCHMRRCMRKGLKQIMSNSRLSLFI